MLMLGVTVSPLRDVHDQVIGRVINFQDLTELRRLELHVRRAERLATVGQLAAGIAHEIRNPLASISGSIELLRPAPQASEDDRALMAIVNREIQRLNVLIGDLLDYANPRPSSRSTSISAVLVDETAAGRARRRGVRRRRARVRRSTRPLPIHADPAKLRQVVWNLVRNARRRRRGGGKHVRVEARARAERRDDHRSRDDGPGIADRAWSRGSSIRSSRRSRRAPASASRRATRSSPSTAAGSTSRPSSAKGTTMIVSLPTAGVGAL